MDNLKNIKSEEKEIDILELFNKLWKRRGFILKISSIGLIIGIIIAFSIPKTYTTSVILAPQSPLNSIGNVGALAAMAGFDIGNADDNVLASPEIFPTILSSTPFLLGLFDVRVQDAKENIDTTFYAYLKNDQQTSWSNKILKVPSKIIGLFSNKPEKGAYVNSATKKKSSIIILTPEDNAIINKLKDVFNIAIDKKTGTITLSTTLKNPQISVYIADTVTSYLQKYITNYKTEKARQDLEFSEKLYYEAKVDYYKKQQDLAAYSDANIAVISAKYATTRDRLQNEVNLAYNSYNQMSQQLQMVKIKMQNITPVYTIIQPAVMPLLASAPNKKLIIIGFTLFFFLGSSAFLLLKDYFRNNRKF